MLLDDRFANILAARVVQSAANVETFVELLTGISIAQGLGIVIDAVEYSMNNSGFRQLKADTDVIELAITTSNQLTDLDDLQDRRILDSLKFVPVVNTAVGYNVYITPVKKVYEPPLIVASPRIYFGCDSEGASAAVTATCRLYYRFIALSTKEYLEIAETFILTS